MTLSDTAPADHATSQKDTGETATFLKILLTVVLLLAGWALAVVQWGVPGLYIPALASVPVIMIVLLMITKG
ncbi:hypothetical protein [Roseovarius salinarum]|uniref:hypothetical protein n=1 Tax=Roseovarius salinarum TaxID=1981892 RepID=UPI000C33EE5A|nr:hypothetical protein [Roseovarius salinarum]